ncbi:anti-repressor SinI family protein [Robertmurraya korlensis]|nr:anti-repressor SinI family protein [Robertmurraya korlensis]
MLQSIISKHNLDEEWVVLILHALDIGISAEEIHNFLSNPRP